MNNLVSKFQSVKVENVNRIDQEDRNFCEKFNNIYSETLECYKTTLENLIKLYNKQIVLVENTHDLYISIYGSGFGISDAKNSILKLKQRFISKICYYFQNKYNVTIDSEKIANKYADKELAWHQKENRDKTLKYNLLEYIHLDYNIILDEIFIQLNGFSFYEKAVNEIKEKARMPLFWYSYRKYWNYEVKGKTIKFKVNINKIKPALYYYDNDEKEIIDCYTYNRIDDYKSYENGNTDIKFINSAYALEFAKKYLGYVEMTEKEREIYKTKCN